MYVLIIICSQPTAIIELALSALKTQVFLFGYAAGKHQFTDFNKFWL